MLSKKQIKKSIHCLSTRGECAVAQTALAYREALEETLALSKYVGDDKIALAATLYNKIYKLIGECDG